MRFTFETDYHQKALSVMARCIRKTVRRSKSKRSHIFGWLVVALALLLSFSSSEEAFAITAKEITTWITALVIVLALLFEDQLNGYFARKRMLKGTEKAFAVFDTEKQDSFLSETAIGKTEFSYSGILLVAETEKYFVFLLSASHAQIYDKSSLTGGTVDEFRTFITERTDKEIVFVK
ncbi:MAG: YcxB family protein [Oscillospiraceae bacterium]|nr:YcxB family protein [Oscillospiraceae bacterium]